jgi:hypothetical protein
MPVGPSSLAALLFLFRDGFNAPTFATSRMLVGGRCFQLNIRPRGRSPRAPPHLYDTKARPPSPRPHVRPGIAAGYDIFVAGEYRPRLSPRASSLSNPARVSPRATALGNFRDQMWGDNRDRGQPPTWLSARRRLRRAPGTGIHHDGDRGAGHHAQATTASTPGIERPADLDIPCDGAIPRGYARVQFTPSRHGVGGYDPEQSLLIYTRWIARGSVKDSDRSSYHAFTSYPMRSVDAGPRLMLPALCDMSNSPCSGAVDMGGASGRRTA